MVLKLNQFALYLQQGVRRYSSESPERSQNEVSPKLVVDIDYATTFTGFGFMTTALWSWSNDQMWTPSSKTGYRPEILGVLDSSTVCP